MEHSRDRRSLSRDPERVRSAAAERLANLDKALRILRERQGFSQADLAAALGVAASTVSSWERGVRVPSLPVLAGVAEALGLGLGDLDEALDLVNGRHRRAAGGEPAGAIDLRQVAKQLAGTGAVPSEDEEAILHLLEALARTFGGGGRAPGGSPRVDPG